MRTPALVLIGVSAFVVVLGIIYWLTSYEDSGSILLVAAIGFALIPGLFLLRSKEERSEVVGEFPSSSIWPFVLAIGAVAAGIGLIFGLWTVLPGAVLLVVGFLGGVRETF